RMILTTSENKTARCWDAVTGRPLGEPFQHKFAAKSIHFSPDGRFVAMGPGLHLWDRETRNVIYSDDDGIFSSFSPDGRTIAVSTAGDGIRLIDVATGKPFSRFLGGYGGADSDWMVFSSDGRLALTVWDSLSLWHSASGKRIGPRIVQGYHPR